MIERTRKECIQCGKCTRNCVFLEKYKMNLKDFSYREDLRYHCFMCGKCKEVCPMDLSGTQIALELRREKPEGVKFTKWMKDPYKLRNNSTRKSVDLLFLGCNYPGFYPETCNHLIEICEERGIDFSVDCCKKPVYESGVDTSFSSLEKMMEAKGVERLICACPNCFHLLKKKLSIEIISVYEFLYENNLGRKIPGSLPIFFPCSDRYDREIFAFIEKYIDNYQDDFYEINCCGLGGGASKKEASLLEQTRDRIEELQEGDIYTYCSSCSGIFKKYELKNIRNILSEILGVEEEVTGDYVKNVLGYKFKKRGKDGV